MPAARPKRTAAYDDVKKAVESKNGIYHELESAVRGWINSKQEVLHDEKNKTYFNGEPGEKFAVVNAGGGFY